MLKKLRTLPLLLLMLLQLAPGLLQPAPHAAGTLPASGALQAIVSQLGAAPAEAATWQTLKDATFVRPNTSTSSAGNQTAVGENWIDSAGSVWSINNNLLKGVGSATQGNTLLRPVSEKQTEQRIVVNRVQTANTETWGEVLREQSDTSRYYAFVAGATLRINRVSSSNVVTQLTSTVLAQQPLLGDNVNLDFSVTGGAGTASLSLTYTNNTTGATSTISITDSSGSKISTAGQCGIDVASSGNFTFAEIIVYYDNTSSATITPTAVQSGATNTTLSLVGSGTSWVSGTTFTLTASGANGASLGTVTFTDSTHIAVVLSNSGSANDSLLIKDNTSGTLTLISVTAPVITVLPIQVITSTTGNTMLVRGNVQTWLSSPPTFTVSGVTGVSITATTVTSNTTATITVTAGSNTGTVTLSDTNASYPASTTFAVNYAIKMSDSNVVLSPYNWQLSGSLYADTNYAGAYMRVRFTTTSTGVINILYDPARNIAGGLASSNYPTIGWSLNPASSGGKWFFQQLSSNTGTITVSASAPAGTYDLQVYVKSIRGGSDGGRWNPSCRGVRLTGIQVDPSATTAAISKRSKNAIFYGDSITQGVGTLGLTSAANDDSFSGWVRACADALGCEYGNRGLSGQQWGGTITTIPAFYLSSNTPADTLSYYEAGQSSLVSGHLSPVPDYVFVNMGTNDITSGIASNVQSTIGLLRSITSSTTPIFLCMPYGGYESSTSTGIPAGFNNYKAANPSDSYVYLIDTTGLYPTTGLNNSTGTSENQYTFDGLHPKAIISSNEGATTARQAQAAVAAGGSGSRGVSRQIRRNR